MLWVLGQAVNSHVTMHVAAGTGFAYNTMERVLSHHPNFEGLVSSC